MLSQSHFTAFNDIKSKHFSNALIALAFMFNSCKRRLTAQELGDNRTHILYALKFCRSRCLQQSRYLLSIERVLVRTRSV